MQRDLRRSYLRWTCARAALARGYWLVTALYLVLDARLGATELLLVGAFQSITVVVAEVPCGVLADAVSRRLSLVVGHVVMGTGMAMVGMVTGFPLIVVSQCLWGLGWAFSSGADVAWLTDQLAGEPAGERAGAVMSVDRVLTAQARWDLLGNPIGATVLALVAWCTNRPTAIVVSGVAMIVLGVAVVARWPELPLAGAVEGGRVDGKRGSVRAGVTRVARAGVAAARGDRVVLLLVGATFLVNGGWVAYGRLLDRRLVHLGMPTQPNPLVWFAALNVAGVVLGACVLAVVQRRIEGLDVARRTYVSTAAAGAVGVLLFAQAATLEVAIAGALLVSGIAEPVVRACTTVWVNRRVTSDVRATVHSIVAQAENLGEIACGLLLALAATRSTTFALTASAVFVGAAAVLVARARADRTADRDRSDV